MASSDAVPRVSFDTTFAKTSTTGENTLVENPNSDLEEPAPEDEEFRQDWSRNVPLHETAAHKERRRSTPFANVNNAPFMNTNHPHRDYLAPKSPDARERKGSILSVWSQGDEDEAIEDGDALERVNSAASKKSLDVPERKGRRGSILSVWKKGKDEQGRDVILQD